MTYDDLGFREVAAPNSALSPTPSHRQHPAPSGPRPEDVARANEARRIAEAAQRSAWQRDRFAQEDLRLRREAEARYLRDELRAIEAELSALRPGPDAGDLLGRGGGSLLGGGVGLLAAREVVDRKHRGKAAVVIVSGSLWAARIQALRSLDVERRRLEARARQLRRDIELAERPIAPFTPWPEVPVEPEHRGDDSGRPRRRR